MSDDSTEKSSGLFDQPVAVEGKRRRKGIESFAITHEAKRPVLEYKGGSGTKLGDIARIREFIARHAADDLKPLHRICLDRPGSRLEVKKNLREFTGFTFERDSERYMRKKASLDKLTKTDLRGFLDTLALPRTGSKEEQIERILDFLLDPYDSGKSRPLKRRRKSSASKKSNTNSSGGSTKKAKLSSGEETPDDEEEEEEEEEEVVEEKADEEVEEAEEEEGEEEAEDENQYSKETTRKVNAVLKVKEAIKEPDDSELMETVKAIVKDADLQQATTKSVCLQVYAKYPGVDLSARKKYIITMLLRTKIP